MPFTPKFVDLVRNFTTVQGTGPVTISAAVAGYTSLAQALGPGDQFYYCLQGVDNPQEREVGRGTLQADGKVAREPINGEATNFSKGMKTIALVAAAEWFTRFENGGSGGSGGAAIEADSAASLAARTTASGLPALLTQDGKEGLFTFDASNLATQVAADTAQGLFIAPTSDATGASGAWVRKFSGSVNVRWFGATGDGVTDDSPAFVAAIALLKATAANAGLWYKGSAKLFVPAGAYFMGTTTLDITHTLVIEGDSTGLHDGQASLLKWTVGTTGIRIQRYNTTGANSVIAPVVGVDYGGDGSVIRNLALHGGDSFPTVGESEAHGIHIKARCAIENANISYFPGDGVYVNANSTAGAPTEGEASFCQIRSARITLCRVGLYIDGADANIWNVQGVDATSCRRAGIFDSSFLGNSFFGCHTATNGYGPGSAVPSAVSHGGQRYAVKIGQEAAAATNAPTGTTADNDYWLRYNVGGPDTATLNVPAWTNGITVRTGGSYVQDNINAATVIAGCYSEGGQPLLQGNRALVVGGAHGGIRGCPMINSNNFGQFVVTTPIAAGTGTILFDGSDAQVGRHIAFSHPTKAASGYALKWNGNDLQFCYADSGLPANQPFQISGPTSAAAQGTHKMNFPDGFGLSGKKVKALAAAPTTGTWAVGDIALNNAPTAGKAFAWRCIAAGTPGTWEELFAGPPPVVSQSGTAYTAVLADANRCIRFTNAAAVAFTLPQDSAVAFPIGTVIEVEQAGAGALSFVAGAGASVNSRGGDLTLAAQYGVAKARKVAANTWTVSGDL